MITNETILAKGFNKDHRISSSFPREILTDFTPFEIKDENDNKWIPISAVCGKFYTLINVSNPENKNETRLVYSFKDMIFKHKKSTFHITLWRM